MVSRRPRIGQIGLGVMLAAFAAGLTWAQSPSIDQRDTVAQVVITGSRTPRYDGKFVLTAKSSTCGEIAKEASITGTAVFVVEFPADGTGNEPIRSISFGSKELVGGVTKSTAFRLNVNVRTAQGGTPPAYVLNTDPPSPKNVGTATLMRKGNETTLRVVGQNDMGETIDLTVTCR
jgi:hypothetical protein